MLMWKKQKNKTNAFTWKTQNTSIKPKFYVKQI